ncbi:MAG: YdjC family protein [Clostridia bacterium 62_21]|nr:MAG: YdjC family protein [Clostridia bacterium 62_21]HAG07946.1 carbohydrate deacetylase [Peptococcaceae bacterium]
MLLIVNADDFGYTPAVSRGIVRAVREGVVTSVSLLVNMPGTQAALAAVRSGIPAGVGVHLCLTRGRPLSEPRYIPSLVSSNGEFAGRDRLLQGSPNAGEVEREFYAQVAYVQSAGVHVTHLDTHHHIHRHPVILSALIRVARALKLPVRSLDEQMRGLLTQKGIRTPDYFCGEWFAEGVSLANFKACVKKGLERGARVMELMTHPGEVDDELAPRSGYTVEREKELAILCDPGLRQWLAETGVRLGTYADVTRT